MIPTYNRPEFLRQALESVVNQTFKPYECIVADDNPDPDESEKNYKVVKEFAEKYPFIKYHKNDRNLGPVENYKNLFNLSTGEYIHFLGDDDILNPKTLELLVKPLEDDEDIKVSAGKTLFVDENLDIINLPVFYEHYKSQEKYFKNVKVNGKEFIVDSLNRIANTLGSFSGFMFRKNDVKFEIFKHNDFEFRTNADWFLWMSLVKDGYIFLHDFYSNLFRISGTNDQLYIRTTIKGHYEILYFYSEEFLKHLNIEKDNIDRRKAIDNVLLGSFYISSKDFPNIIDFYEKRFLSKVQINKENREAFSIIIITYNSSQTIKDCLDSIKESFLHPEDEVIIVDNNSKDDTVQVIKNYKGLNINLIENKENLGYSKAINQGVNYAKNEYLVFLNPDTQVLSKDWLNRFYKSLQNDKVAMVGPVSDVAMYKNNFASYTYIYVLPIQSELLEKHLKYIYNEKNVEVEILSGFCIGIKKDTFYKLGKFDENLILGFDDFDFSLKTQEISMKNVVLPSVFVKHLNHKSFETDKTNAENLNKISLYNFIKKLIKKYGYGNVPTPNSLFFKETVDKGPYYPFPLSEGRYRFVFNFSKTQKDKTFYREKAKIIKSKPSITILTVNYFSSDYLQKLAESVVKNSYPNINLLVVDNSENEKEYENLKNTLETIFKNAPTKRFYLLKNKNTGYAGGNNKGVEFIKQNLPDTKYIWILNPDTVISENTPLELVKTVEYTDVPVATCKTLMYENDKVQYAGSNVYIDGIDDNKDYGIFYPKFLSGANIFIKSDILNKLPNPLFNEEYFLYFEDNEFVIELEKRGIKFIYTPFTYIRHKIGGTTNGFAYNPLSYYYLIRNWLYLNQKYTEDDLEKIESMNNFFNEKLNESIHLGRDYVIAFLNGVYDYYKNIKGKKEKLNPDKSFVKTKLKEIENSTSLPYKIDYYFHLGILKPQNRLVLETFLKEVLRYNFVYKFFTQKYDNNITKNF